MIYIRGSLVWTWFLFYLSFPSGCEEFLGRNQLIFICFHQTTLSPHSPLSSPTFLPIHIHIHILNPTDATHAINPSLHRFISSLTHFILFSNVVQGSLAAPGLGP
ncbi:MAG: hypothetical protein BYD32DRAFT_422379 [Podila humilis]|nr:MAG: hypothetical protein BYD32DRAFT_422379 [Podila humilis]